MPTRKGILTDTIVMAGDSFATQMAVVMALRQGMTWASLFGADEAYLYPCFLPDILEVVGDNGMTQESNTANAHAMPGTFNRPNEHSLRF